MLNYLAPFLMFISIFAMITIILINLMKYWLKNKMLNAGMMEESRMRLILQPNGPKAELRSALKWGLITLFGGSGLIVNEYLKFDPYTSALPYGIELIFISLGLLIYYLITRKQPVDETS
jgi:hypothetical protein